MCDHVPVNRVVRTLAMFALLLLVVATGAAREPLVPVIRLDAGPGPNPESEPPVSFAIPKFELSTEERHLVAACLVLEAASQGDFGMRSVMSVIRNRARGLPELFTSAVLRPKQFSALNKLTAGRESRSQAIARAKRDRMWPTALKIVDDATFASWHDSTGGATHYTRTGERTPWTRALTKTVTIGAHSFYR